MSDKTWFDELDPAHQGAARLAQASLGNPKPAALAENESRRRVLAMMEDAALSPRVLWEMPTLTIHGSWLSRLRRFWKR